MDQAISQQVLKHRAHKRMSLIIAMLATVSATAWGINHYARPSIAGRDIIISEVRTGSIANTINASGIVIPSHEELVTSPIQSHVTHIQAKLGQQVEAGDLLLELDGHSVEVLVDNLKEQLAQQENRIQSLNLEMEQKRKQTLSSIELLELDLRTAKVKWERSQTLRKSGAVSGEDHLAAELNVKRAEIQLRQQHETIEDNRRATLSAIEGAHLQKNILSKQLEQQQQLLAQTRVRAPSAGVVTTMITEEGSGVMPGQVVVKVSDMSHYRVEASISDFYAHSLEPGQAVRIEQGSMKLTGHVTSILPEIQNGSVKCLVNLDQSSDQNLRNKMRVDVNIVTAQKEKALVVETGAAFNGRGRQEVFVIKDGVARKTLLELGSSDGKMVEIVSGAQTGDQVIVSDTGRFKDYDNIRVAQ